MPQHIPVSYEPTTAVHGLQQHGRARVLEPVNQTSPDVGGPPNLLGTTLQGHWAVSNLDSSNQLVRVRRWLLGPSYELPTLGTLFTCPEYMILQWHNPSLGMGTLGSSRTWFTVPIPTNWNHATKQTWFHTLCSLYPGHRTHTVLTSLASQTSLVQLKSLPHSCYIV